MSTDATDLVRHKFHLCEHIAQLERELNDAKARIARMVSAGDNLLQLCEAEAADFHMADQIDALCEEWRKAKL